jgi:hypothetical protein
MQFAAAWLLDVLLKQRPSQGEVAEPTAPQEAFQAAPTKPEPMRYPPVQDYNMESTNAVKPQQMGDAHASAPPYPNVNMATSKMDSQPSAPPLADASKSDAYPGIVEHRPRLPVV